MFETKSNDERFSWYKMFQRVTSNGDFLPSIDGLRFVAIVFVILHHLNGYVVAKGIGFTEAEAREYPWFHWFQGANCGVQIFFTISGFILALPFARERLPWGKPVLLNRYFLRRLTRLEPPYLINLVIASILLVAVREIPFRELLTPLLASVTYTHNLIYGKMSQINGVAWSLEIEVQFYLLAPILMRLYFTLSKHLRRRLAVVSIFVWMLSKYWVPLSTELQLRCGLLYVLDHFLVGLLLADVYSFTWKPNEFAKDWKWDVGAAVSLPAIVAIQSVPTLYHFLPLLTAFLLAGALQGALSRRLLSFTPIVVIGGMCYSIYLYHFFVISLVGRFTIPYTAGWSYNAQLIVQTLLILPVSIIACALFFAAFERPFMRWGNGCKQSMPRPV